MGYEKISWGPHKADFLNNPLKLSPPSGVKTINN